MTYSLPAAIRPATGEHTNAVLDTWLRSMRTDADNAHMSNEVYYAIERPRVIRMLERSRVLVAANPADDWQIYGWIAASGDRMHFVYTKYPYRRASIASRLFDAAGKPSVATHAGKNFDVLRARWLLSFDPREVKS